MRAKDILIFVVLKIMFVISFVFTFLCKGNKEDKVIIIDIAKKSKGSFGDDALIVGAAEALCKKYKQVFLIQYSDNEGRNLDNINQYANVGYLSFPFKILKEFKTSKRVVLPLADQADGRYGSAIIIWNYLLGYYASLLKNEVVYCSFSYSAHPTIVANFYLKRMSKFAVVHVRDCESQKRLEKFTDIKASCYPDLAFGMKKRKSTETDKVIKMFPTNKKVIGINLNLLPIKKQDIDEYINVWAKIVRWLAEKNYYLVFLAHDTRMPADDRIVNQRVIKRAGIKKELYYVVENIYSSPEIKEIISTLDFLITGRMHASIAALSTGVPILFVDYNDKGIGLVKYFFEDYLGIISGKKIFDFSFLQETLICLLDKNSDNREIIIKKKDLCIKLAEKQVEYDE